MFCQHTEEMRTLSSTEVGGYIWKEIILLFWDGEPDGPSIVILFSKELKKKFFF